MPIQLVQEHYMWAYARFLLYLEETDPAELNGPESYVKPVTWIWAEFRQTACRGFTVNEAADQGEQHRLLPHRALHRHGATASAILTPKRPSVRRGTKKLQLQGRVMLVKNILRGKFGCARWRRFRAGVLASESGR